MKFKIAKHKNFHEPIGIDLEKTINFLKNGDFKSADSKKLSNSSYFRAKTDIKGRLLFQFGYVDEISYIFLLDVLPNHEYEESLFLKGKKVYEEDFIFDETNIEKNTSKEKFFHYSENFIIFNKTQENILYTNPPLIIVGSAGSGKTSVTIEKLRKLNGKVLYVSIAQELVNNAQDICGEYKNIDFLSFEQFINNIKKQEGRVIDFYTFKKWANKNTIKEVEKYFEEFKGVLTADNNNQYISLAEYKNLGRNQSLFKEEMREKVYENFKKYLQFLKENNLYDNNIAIYSLFEITQETYDFIVIDEIQDFTNKEIALILQSLKDKRNFIFSGDANQIIYSNFFSWSQLKTMLYKDKTINAPITILQENYRNSKNITNVANNLLKIKQLQFGSIDKESNYLIETKSTLEGNVHFYEATEKNIKEINEETENSRKVAVIVFDEATKNEIKKDFKTALIYTVHEVKGLEYDEIILINFVSNNIQSFNEIIKGIDKSDLSTDLKYNRSGKKDTEKRLESFKIYINSLYVALTRGVKKLYILEKRNHRIFELLNVVQEEKKEIIVEQSSNEEWEQEALKLEKLGKIEQVEEIRKKIVDTSLKSKEVIKDIDIFQLKDEALNPNKFNKKAKDAFFKIVKEKNQLIFIEKLAELKYIPAKNYLNSLNNLKKEEKKVVKKRISNIIKYAYQGNVQELKKLIENNADVDFQTKDGETALMIAAGTGQKEIIKLLLENNANPNLTRKDGDTVLTIATKFANYEIIKILINNNVDINQPVKNGDSALMIASAKGNKEIVDLFLNNNADVNFQSKKGKTALIVASEYNKTEIIELLLNKNADVNFQTKEHNSALMIATANKNIEIVKTLLNYNANTNLHSKNGETALIVGVALGHKEIVQYLLDSGANINHKKNDGKSALIFAIYYGHKEIVKLLLDNGANPNIEDDDGISPLIFSAYVGNSDITQLLLDCKVNINYQCQSGRTALMFAIENNKKDVVELLLENGANLSIKSENEETALSIALKENNEDILKLLK
jgi:ankyrin repeat protein/superfamily I DNA/RNA helicase